MRREVDLRRELRLVDVGILPESEGVLDLQDVAHAAVDLGHRHLAVLDELHELPLVETRHHVLVHAGRERKRGEVRMRLGHSVPVELALLDSLPVGDREALEAEMAAEDVRQQPLVHAAGHAVERVERRHHRERARPYAVLERRKVHIAERRLAHLNGVVVTARLCPAVGGKVLEARGDGQRARARLYALYERRAHLAAKIGVLSRPLGDAAPARIAAHVHHRRKRPVAALRRRLDRNEPSAVVPELFVPRAGKRQRNRRLGHHAVDHVVSDH